MVRRLAPSPWSDDVIAQVSIGTLIALTFVNASVLLVRLFDIESRRRMSDSLLVVSCATTIPRDAAHSCRSR